MLKSIKINNFKSVQDLEIELGRLNVFIGENGCGKTSILEAIGLASAAISNKLDQEFLASRGIRVTDPRLMKSAFNKSNDDSSINIHLTNTSEDYIDYGIDYKNRTLLVDEFASNINVELAQDKFQEVLDVILSNDELFELFKAQTNNVKDKDERRGVISEKFLKLINEYYINNKDSATRSSFISSHSDQYKKKFNFANFLIYTPENYFLRRFEEEGQINPIGVRGEGLFKHLEELFKNDEYFANAICDNLKLINWFEGLEIPSDLAFNEMRLNIKDRFIKDTIDYFDQRSANEGFLYLLFYFTLFLSKETPDFFAIDNVDNALNPKLCKELIERLTVLSKTNDKQVILTTHNASILDGLDLKDDQQRLFVIYRNANGHTKAKRVKPPKDIEGIETVRLSEAFIRGYIGGLPKNF